MNSIQPENPSEFKPNIALTVTEDEILKFPAEFHNKTKEEITNKLVSSGVRNEDTEIIIYLAKEKQNLAAKAADRPVGKEDLKKYHSLIQFLNSLWPDSASLPDSFKCFHCIMYCGLSLWVACVLWEIKHGQR